MFDISWTEFLLIGVVALVVIGPKELPAVLRTLGQWTRRVRSMAADFQGQFQEALREAEMADLKKQVDDIAHDIKSYDPLKDVRADVEAAGKDLKSSLEQPAPEPSSLEQSSPEQPSPEQPALEQNPALITDGPQSLAPDAVATATGPVTPGAVDQSAPPLPPPEPDVAMPEGEFVGAGIGPAVPDESPPKPDVAGHAE
jgi:sec-independent protein translocase protein TatB